MGSVSRIVAALVCLLLFIAPGPGGAQVLGTAISYQGELRFQGQPAQGSFDLQFTPYPNSTSSVPLAPTVTVNDLAIVDGLIAVPLDFGPGVFLGDSVALQLAVRPGASTGAFQLLSPRVPILAAPYALKVRAGSVTDIELAAGSVRTDAIAAEAITMAKMAAGSVGFEQLVSHSVSTSHLVDDAVTAAKMAPSAVGSSELADGSVSSVDIADGLITATKLANLVVTEGKLANSAVTGAKLADAAVSTIKVADAAITAPKLAAGAVTAAAIAPGAIGASQVNAASVQLRVNAECPSGLALRGIAADGDPVCNGIDRVLDQAGAVGLLPAISMRPEGLPVIVAGRAEQGALRVTLCKDRLCRESETVDTEGTQQAFTESDVVMPASGRPILTFKSPGVGIVPPYVAVRSCTTRDCRQSTLATVDVADARYLRIALRGNGLPVVAYQDAASADLKLFDCQVADCTSGSIRTLASAGEVGSHLDLALRSDDRPVLSYHDASNGDLRIYLCDNAGCSTGTSRALATIGTVGTHTSLGIRTDGRPIVAFRDVTQQQVRVADCTLADCSAVVLRTIENQSSIEGISLAMRPDGRAAIAYGSTSNQPLRLATCGNESCSSGNVLHTVRSGVSIGFRGVALTFRADGLPLIALHDPFFDDLRLFACQDSECGVDP